MGLFVGLAWADTTTRDCVPHSKVSIDAPAAEFRPSVADSCAMRAVLEDLLRQARESTARAALMGAARVGHGGLT